jgi:hypothetical protein
LGEDLLTLCVLGLTSITGEEDAALYAPFGRGKIKGVFVDSDGNNNTGLNGFCFAFFKKYWSILEGVISTMFDQCIH